MAKQKEMEKKTNKGQARGRGRNKNWKRGRTSDQTTNTTTTRNENIDGNMHGYNDISWYSRNPNLLAAAASFPYPYRPGMMLRPSMDFQDVNPAYNANVRIPGVMALEWMPSVGYATENIDPISVCAKEFYAKVRSAFSGSLDADPPDFIMYLMALDSIYTYIAWLKRLYRVLTAWDPQNFNMPDALLQAMGISAAEVAQLRVDKVKLWQLINELVLQTRKFKCPAVMDIFNRHYWMSDNVYSDASSLNSQFYMFNLAAVYILDPNMDIPGDATNKAAGLRVVKLPTTSSPLAEGSVTAQTLYEFGLALIQALVSWDDGYLIAGYLTRAYEGVPSFTVDELPADQPFNVLYDEEVLTQIENCRTIADGECWYSRDQTQFNGFSITANVYQNPNTNTIVSTPQVRVNSAADALSGYQVYSGMYSLDPIITLRSDAPTPVMTTIASRLTAVPHQVTNAAGTTVIAYSVGTEIPIVWHYVLAQQTESSYGVALRQFAVYTNGGGTPGAAEFSTISRLIIQSAVTSQFDWSPLFYSVGRTLASETTQEVFTNFQLHGDIHNVTTVERETMRNLHKVCILSELNAYNA